MLLPRKTNRLFDDFFNNDFWMSDLPALKSVPSMKTDIKEVDGNYELSVELPGFNKEDISVELKNGYLTISAKHEESDDKKDDNGNYIRRERKVGSCVRSFYVGSAVKEEDIKAAYENGILKLSVPKDKEEAVEDKKLIRIE